MNESYRVRSPGCLTLIGGYTDGYAVSVATDRRTELTATPATDVTITAESTGETRSFATDDHGEAGDWTDAVRGCFAVLADAGYEVGGFEGTVESPLDGDSPSLVVAVLAFLGAAYDLEISRSELARLARRVRAEFGGVDCGPADHAAIALSKAEHALFLDAETGEYDRLRMPDDVALLVFETGARGDDSALEQSRETVQAALAELGADTSKAVDLAALSRLSDRQARRLGYVVRENTRVRQALGALDEGDPERLGAVLVESHQDAASNFGASTPELDWVVEQAIEAGAYGARHTGVVPGETAVVLVDRERARQVAERLETTYAEAFPDREGRSSLVEPVDGVIVDSP